MKAVIYSDYVCPFCFLEIPALERLAAETGVELDYRAYELRPDPVPTLDPAGSYLTTAWRDAVYPLAERLGVPIKLPPVQPRSRLAFVGAEFARDHGKLAPYTRAVHEAFFQRGEDIGRADVLAGVAAGVGLDATPFRTGLADPSLLARVLEQEAEAHRLGVNAVPIVFLNGYVLRGCVGYDTLRAAAADATGRPHGSTGGR
ncbi:MAG TPA: DsbA family protein [Humisphaera sp.]